MSAATQAMAAGPGTAPARVLTGRGRLLLFAVMALGMFMSLLDVQIVSASLPEIEAGLSAGSDEGAWIQTAYLIAEIVMIPLSGFLSRAFSTRWVFTASAAAFTIASIACGFAWNIGSMIAFRAIQGFVGGAMIPTVFAAGFALFRGPKQALVGAVLGMIATLAPTIGPTLGGQITELANWHWLFFVNVVPGLLILALVPVYGRIDEPDLRVLRGFDPWAIPLLAAFLGGLEYTLEEGPRWNWFEDQAIVTGAVVSLLAGVAFFWRSVRHPRPVVELSLFRDRRFALACAFQFVTGIGIFTSVYLMPQFLARVRGYGSGDIGTTVFVVGVFQVLSTPLAAAASKRLDGRWMLAIGFGGYGLAMLLMQPLTAQWNGAQLFASQALRGFSSMFCIIPASGMALGAMPPARLKQASGLSNLMRNLGGAIGIAAANTVLNDRYNLHYQMLAEALRGSGRALGETLVATTQRLHALGAGAAQDGLTALALLQRLLAREALTMTFADAFVLIGIAYLSALLLLLAAPAVPPTAAASADHH